MTGIPLFSPGVNHTIGSLTKSRDEGSSRCAHSAGIRKVLLIQVFGILFSIRADPCASVVTNVFYKNDWSKGIGKSADMRWHSILPFRFARTTSASPQNSHRIWRHDPHGGVGVSVSATTATASNPRSPSEIALKIATLSAQSVTP